jgi:hypothetical protein
MQVGAAVADPFSARGVRAGIRPGQDGKDFVWEDFSSLSIDRFFGIYLGVLPRALELTGVKLYLRTASDDEGPNFLPSLFNSIIFICRAAILSFLTFF